jgi:hypothetical protein
MNLRDDITFTRWLKYHLYTLVHMNDIRGITYEHQEIIYMNIYSIFNFLQDCDELNLTEKITKQQILQFYLRNNSYLQLYKTKMKFKFNS